MRVDKRDLEWWLDKYTTLRWSWAKTYAESAPHHYVVRGKQLNNRDAYRLMALIWTFGEPQKFWRTLNLYLVADGYKWWYSWDWEPQSECRVVNMAPADQFFGTQDAPDTRSDHFGVYDTLCIEYDEIASRDYDYEVKAILGDYLENPWPWTLDVGAGTGRLLDLGITTPAYCTVVDPSQGMLNTLLRKYMVLTKTSLARIIPAKIEDCYEEFEPELFDLVASLYGAASYVHPEVVAKLPLLSKGLTVLMTYKPGYLPEWWKGWPLPDTVDDVAELVKRMGGRQFDLGNYDLTVIERKTSLF